MATNYGDLEIDVTIDGEVDGEVQEATGGIADKNYNHLNHKPQINSVELEGNKSLEDLGIPENLSDLGDVEITDIRNGQTLIYNSESEKFENADAGTGSGDMLKSVYDTNDDGSVDSADTLVGLEASVTELNALDGIEGNVQNQLNSKADSSGLGTASAYDVPESGDAQSGEVVLGSDTRLSDSRNAKDVYLWAKQENKPTYNYSEIQNAPTVNNSTITFQKNSQNVDSFTLNQDSNKSINITVPTKTSDLQNDSSFITNAVNNLANYYLKNQTYTQTEVDNLIQAAVNGRFQKVNSLPVTGEPNIIYLVPKTTPETSNACDEYIWQDNAWELIGSTEIDLSDYVTDEDLTTALQDYLTTSAFNTAIANYYTKTEIGTLLDGKVDVVPGKGLSTNDYDATAKGIVDSVTSNLANKVDKENGKGLSTNDYDNTAKGIVDGVTNALAGKVDKEDGKVLSANDFTNAYKDKLDGISEGAKKTESSETNGNIKIDGTETQVYNDEEIQGKLSTATATSTGNPINFTTKSAQNAVSTIIDLEPIQDLHGYDKPWVGGGKNKLPMTLANIKALNTSGTWTGNVYTLYQVAITVLTDNDDNVTGLDVHGTPSASLGFVLAHGVLKDVLGISSGSVTLNGCPSGGVAYSTYQITVNDGTNNVTDTGNGVTFDVSTYSTTGNTDIFIRLNSGYQANHLKFYPMIRLSTETDSTFAPYTNYASISGRTEIGIEGCGKNLLSGIENGAWNTSTQTKTTNTNRARSNQVIQVVPNTTYRISATTVSKTINCSINYYTGTGAGTYINSSGWQNINYSFTTPNNCRYITIIYATQSGSDANPEQYISNAQLELGSSATNYSPYTKSNDITIQFGETVYGGSLDVEKGVLTVDRAIVTYLECSSVINTLENRTLAQFSPISTSMQNYSDDYICDMFETGNAAANTSVIGSYFYNNLRVRFPENYGSTKESISAMLSDNPVSFAYPLATPITIQLTPHQISLLKGVNNISVSDDYSTITLTYRSGEVATLGDLKEQIDELKEEIPTAWRRYYKVIGQFVKSTTMNMAGYGIATIDIIGEVARIDFTFKITNSSGSSSDFNWGISVSALKQLNPNIPDLYPMQGGNFWTNQANYADLIGYGDMWSPTNLEHSDDLYWVPARQYTTSGDIGGWSSDSVRTDGIWMGCCFAGLHP